MALETAVFTENGGGAPARKLRLVPERVPRGQGTRYGRRARLGC